VIHDGNKVPKDIVIGFDSFEQYQDDNALFGCIAGCYANRIANGRFEIKGTVYTLSCNHRKHHLHGGHNGFNKKLWGATVVEN
jgi:aldose 1-epimerase